MGGQATALRRVFYSPLFITNRFMNPAEEIVKYWLQGQGYFVQSSIRVEGGANREIDILAIDLKAKNRRHIEVSVSISMAVFSGDAKTKAAEYTRKFDHPSIVKEIKKRFGPDAAYTKELVVGDVAIRHTNVSKEFIEAMAAFDIRVILISDILKEIVPKLGSHIQLNPIIKTVQLTKKFL